MSAWRGSQAGRAATVGFTVTIPALVRRLLVLCCAVLLSSCELSNPFSGDDAAEEQLRNAEARWRDRGLASYRYVSRLSCYCASVGPADVTVINGVVTRVVRRSDGVTEASPTRAPIDSLFAFIRRELERAPELLLVTYDETLGYPRAIQWGTPANDFGGFIFADSVEALR
jgi:hypothetical protein